MSKRVADRFPEGNAVVYCEQAFGTTNGKTAHGLVRRTRRYQVTCVIDSARDGQDAGEVLDRRPSGIPIVANLAAAVAQAERAGTPATHFVVGLAPDGGRLAGADRACVLQAIAAGLHVDCGLHDFLSEDREIAAAAEEMGVRIRDIRKPPPRSELHFFSGKIEEVQSTRIALLGTDSAVGKRTTAWVLVDGLEKRGVSAVMAGTGQTAWLQGAAYSFILDSTVNDFVSGEIEHMVWSAWNDLKPDVIVLEGQGSLMNPAYPGGFELLAAGRPSFVILQHAPARQEYDGFPGFPMHPLPEQIRAIEMISGRPVVAITVNHEGLRPEDVPAVCAGIRKETGLPAHDVLLEGAGPLVESLAPHLGGVASR
ncbi:MAG: hypothetical protein DHS20C21_12170 [Gemmatimonadota bacterium]|nr:MAG: hypothetical protein DHS20C21_12170 [Gemmatimonadota bacterium]